MLDWIDLKIAGLLVLLLACLVFLVYEIRSIARDVQETMEARKTQQSAPLPRHMRCPNCGSPANVYSWGFECPYCGDSAPFSQRRPAPEESPDPSAGSGDTP